MVMHNFLLLRNQFQLRCDDTGELSRPVDHLRARVHLDSGLYPDCILLHPDSGLHYCRPSKLGMN